jgi:hypothetical protein
MGGGIAVGREWVGGGGEGKGRDTTRYTDI